MDLPIFWVDFFVAALATWRVSHLLVNEDGPAGIFARLRARSAGTGIGRALDCFGCISLWVATSAAIFISRRPLELLPVSLALSGAAFLLEKLSGEPLIVERLPESQQGAINDDLLRTETEGATRRAGNDA
jgi:hypothetical protein